MYSAASHNMAYSTELNKSSEQQTEDKAIEDISVPTYTRESVKQFADVIEDLLVIIGEHNFRLTQHSRIGKAIADRNEIKFRSATVLHFCNLGYAKELLEMAPDYLLRMPCRVSVLQTDTDGTIIQVWLLPEDDERTIEFAKKINAILIDIVNYGAI